MDFFNCTHVMTVNLVHESRPDVSARIARRDHRPWPLRLIACVLVVVELLLPCNTQVLVAAELLFAPATTSSDTTAQSRTPAPVLTPQNVTVNRTAPQVTSPPAQPVFSDPPSDQEIFRAREFLPNRS
jgi:hypothetical protein